jgi:hypothetical protein
VTRRRPAADLAPPRVLEFVCNGPSDQWRTPPIPFTADRFAMTPARNDLAVSFDGDPLAGVVQQPSRKKT